MNQDSTAGIRVRLNEQLKQIQVPIKSPKHQEAAEHLCKAEGLFEQLQGIIDVSSKIHRNIVGNRRIDLDALSQHIEDRLEYREAGKREYGPTAEGTRGLTQHQSIVVASSGHSATTTLRLDGIRMKRETHSAGEDPVNKGQ